MLDDKNSHNPDVYIAKVKDSKCKKIIISFQTFLHALLDMYPPSSSGITLYILFSNFFFFSFGHHFLSNHRDLPPVLKSSVKYSMLSVNHHLFTQSLINEHVGCFQFFSTIDNARLNIFPPLCSRSQNNSNSLHLVNWKILLTGQLINVWRHFIVLFLTLQILLISYVP